MAIVGGEKVCRGVGTHDLGFYFRHTWRLAARAASTRSVPISSPLDADAIRPPNPSRPYHRRHILSIRFNAARLIA